MEPQNSNTRTLLPTVGDSYGHSWETMKKYFLELFLVFIIVAAVSMPMGILNVVSSIGHSPVLFLLKPLVFMYGIFLMIPVQYGAAYVFLQAVRGERVEIKDIFLAFENYWNVILAGLLTSAIIILGLVLLIVPGIIFACKLAFVPYLVMDKHMEPIEAVKKSWNMTRGHAMTIFLMALLAFPIAIVGLLMMIVGIIPASIWIDGAFASIYHSVTLEQQEKEALQQA